MQRRTILQAGAALGLVALAPQLFAAGKIKPGARAALIVVDVQNPATEISLEEAQQLYGDEAEVDMEIEFPKPTEVLGRIAAQTAKQVIFQKVREAERENIFGAGERGQGLVGQPHPRHRPRLRAPG